MNSILARAGLPRRARPGIAATTARHEYRRRLGSSTQSPASAPPAASRLPSRTNAAAAASAAAGAAALYSFASGDANRARAEAALVPPPPPAPTEAEPAEAPAPAKIIPAEEQDLVNWSGTHTVHTARYFQPETLQELEALVSSAHATRTKLRPVGSGLSPNALAFSPGGMVNLAQMDAVLSVDAAKMTVTVQAGARVSQVVDALRPHGLTLQNYASITEQQVGGFTQVGAHGTGAAIPPVDEQVVALKLVTPAVGTLDLAASDADPALFLLARTAVGLLGIVAEVTLQCVPAHALVERTFTTSRDEVRRNHAAWLAGNRHLRYMWIPHTDDVVVVTCNPVPADGGAVLAEAAAGPKFTDVQRLEMPRALLKSVSGGTCKLTHAQIDELGFTSLRDELLSVDPLSTPWVRKVNEAEAEFWRKCEGVRADMSDRILGFDCGGQQWVSEVAIPVPADGGHADIDFVFGILELIDAEDIPAPSPIEQRWSAPSKSPMSPACEKPNVDQAPFYSWVGIIMYLPEGGVGAAAELTATRANITTAFKKYKRSCEDKLWVKAHAVEHWAKIERPEDEAELGRMRDRLARKYPLVAFNAIRQLFDPHGVLSNSLTDECFDGIKSQG
jgi:L-galactono-1,4-lactone dehydrogenase